VAAIHGDPDALIAEIRRRAQQRAVDLEEEARKGAAGVLERAKQESESILRQSELETEAKLAALRRHSAAQGELEARRQYTVLREAPIDRVWEAAESRLRNLVAQPSYRDILQRLTLRAARELGVSDPVLADDPAGGLVATSGRHRFDATFVTQLALARALLRERVFEILSKDRH
jgi:vacuolar-type H+-ATPase subunit E/Vma4